MKESSTFQWYMETITVSKSMELNKDANEGTMSGLSK